MTSKLSFSFVFRKSSNNNNNRECYHGHKPKKRAKRSEGGVQKRTKRLASAVLSFLASQDAQQFANTIQEEKHVCCFFFDFCDLFFFPFLSLSFTTLKLLVKRQHTHKKKNNN